MSNEIEWREKVARLDVMYQCIALIKEVDVTETSERAENKWRAACLVRKLCVEQIKDLIRKEEDRTDGPKERA